LVLQTGVKIDDVIEKDWTKNIKIKKGLNIRIGRKFIKII
jgi:hypothetical protein